MAYNRQISMTLGPEGGIGKKFFNLRMAFVINKSNKGTSNKCTCRIYNLMKQTATLSAKVGNTIIVDAGYQDEGTRSLFFGVIKRSKTSKSSTDRITEIEAYDGIKNIQEKTVSLSFAPGTLVKTIVDILVSQFAVARGNPYIIPNKQYANGYAFVGLAKDALTEVLDYIDRVWTIQNEQIYIIEEGEAVNRTGLVLSKETGLIGNPELLEDADDDVEQPTEIAFTKKRYRVKSLLFPQLTPGSDIILKSPEANGTFTIENAEFVGDNFGGDFMCTMEVVA